MYWFPNRPILIPRSELASYSGDPEWTAEIKMDGSRLVLFRTDTGWEFWNRHRELMSYTPTESVLRELDALGVPVGSQLDGELMHTRTKNVKNCIVFYDVYVLGDQKVRGTLDERREILAKMVDGRGFENVTRSKVFESDFDELFDEVIKCREHEGLVLKRRGGKLKFNPVKSDDVEWQVKVRRPHKNYQF